MAFFSFIAEYNGRCERDGKAKREKESARNKRKSSGDKREGHRDGQISVRLAGSVEESKKLKSSFESERKKILRYLRCTRRKRQACRKNSSQNNSNMITTMTKSGVIFLSIFIRTDM